MRIANIFRIFLILTCYGCILVSMEANAQDPRHGLRNSSPKYLYSIGSGTTYSFGSIEGEQEVQYNGGTIRVVPKWSVLWPVSASETGVSSFENFFRRVSLIAGVEKKLSEKISLASGVEAGGRYFMIEEDIEISRMVTVNTNRNYSVYSIPLLLKYNPKWIPPMNLRFIAGIQGNYIRSGTRNGIYVVKNPNAVYPTLSLGLETGLLTKQGNPLIALEAMWQQGFYNVLDEEVKIITPYFAPGDFELLEHEYRIEYSGSHLRVGLKMYFDRNTFKRNISGQRPNSEINSGNVQLINQAELSVKQNTIQVCVIDKQGFDGYQYKLLLNGSVIYENLTIQTIEKCLEIPLEPGSVNYLSLQTSNETSSSENVVSLKVRLSESTSTYFLRYNRDYSETLRIIHPFD